MTNSIISSFFYDFSKNCSKVQKKTFSKGQTITNYIAKRNQFCLLESGEANLVRYDLNGNKTIVEHLNKNDIFGELFYNVTTNNELFVIAKKNCIVLFYSYDFVQEKCEKNCKFHKTLLKTLPNLFLKEINDLNTRLELLSKRTIREKLLAYFTIISTQNMSKTFVIPFSLTDLADYLSIDRSAMMRELSNLKNERIIEKNGNRITLLCC